MGLLFYFILFRGIRQSSLPNKIWHLANINNYCTFLVPKINFSARSISELCDLANSETEAPLTLNLTDCELKAIAFTPMDLDGFPCHTTACERGVQVLHHNNYLHHLIMISILQVTTSSCLVSTDRDLQDGASFSEVAARNRNSDAYKKQWNI